MSSAGARIKPRQYMTIRVAAAHRLHADAVPFPFRDKIGGVEVGEVRILDRVRQHHRAERRRIAVDRRLGAAFQPCEQVEIGRREPRPQQLDASCGSLSSERRGRGSWRAAPKSRSASLPVTSLSSAQRPVSSSSSSHRASCFGSSVLPSVRSVVTTSVSVGGGGLLWPAAVRSPPPRVLRVVGRGRGWGSGGGKLATKQRVPAERPQPPTPPRRFAGGGGKPSPTSAPPSPRDRRHNHRTARTALDRCGRRSGRGSGRAWRA